MKQTEFKKIIKEAVREAIQEELKDILLEAIKSPQSNTKLNENFQPRPDVVKAPTNSNPNELRNKYSSILNETFTTNNVSSPQTPFRPSAVTDPINGQLPPGDVSVDQILGLINSK